MFDKAEAGREEAQFKGKKEWIEPRVRRMAAGSAEDGFGNLPDGGQPS